MRPLGLVHWQASWPLSTPSGQDVSLSEEKSPPVAEGGPLPGPKTLGNELSEKTRVLTKQETALGRALWWTAGG